MDSKELKELRELKELVSEVTALNVKLVDKVVSLHEEVKDMKSEVISFKNMFSKFTNLIVVIFQVTHAGAIQARMARMHTRTIIGFLNSIKDPVKGVEIMNNADKRESMLATDFYSKFITPFKEAVMKVKNEGK